MVKESAFLQIVFNLDQVRERLPCNELTQLKEHLEKDLAGSLIEIISACINAGVDCRDLIEAKEQFNLVFAYLNESKKHSLDTLQFISQYLSSIGDSGEEVEQQLSGKEVKNRKFDLQKDGVASQEIETNGPQFEGEERAKSVKKTASELVKNAVEWKGKGRGGGKFPKFAEPGQILVRRSNSGAVTHYAVYDNEGIIIKRVDLIGKTHWMVETPHVVIYKLIHNLKTGKPYPMEAHKLPRSATPEETL